MIEVAPGIYYDPTKEFAEQSEEFQVYATEKYTAEVTRQVTTIGYPDFNADGSVTFRIDDELLYAEVTRIQVKPKSSSYRAIKETIIEIFVK